MIKENISLISNKKDKNIIFEELCCAVSNDSNENKLISSTTSELESENIIIRDTINYTINSNLSKEVEFIKLSGYKDEIEGKVIGFNIGIIRVNGKEVQLDLERQLGYISDECFDIYECGKYYINTSYTRFLEQQDLSKNVKDGGNVNVDFTNKDGIISKGTGLINSEAVLYLPINDIDLDKRDQWITNTPSGKILSYNYSAMNKEATANGWACCIVSNRILISIKRELLDGIDSNREEDVEKLNDAISKFLIEQDFYIMANRKNVLVTNANHKIYYKTESGKVNTTIDSKQKFSIKYTSDSKQLETLHRLDFNLDKYIVDLDMFGIKDGRLLREQDGSYSKDSYDIAYNNAEGFKDMFYYCKIMNYKNIILPYGDYSICYRNPKGLQYFDNKGWEIYIPTETTFDMNGSTIRVIFDSDNKNPYDNSNNEPFRLNGSIFKISNTLNTVIKNGILIGSKPERSFKNSLERTIDYGVGIEVCDGSRHTKIENMTIKGFMGDGVASTPTTGVKDIIYCKPFIKGFYNNKGKYDTSIDGIFSTDLFDLTGLRYIQISGEIGYSNFPNFSNELFVYNFFTKDKEFISKEFSTYLQTNIVPYNAKYVSLTIFGEDKNMYTIDNKNYKVGAPIPEFLQVISCDILENHRGGIANLANDTLIEFCNIKNNGNGRKEGKPQFNDTTRYAINCEDNVSRSVTIRNCNISDHFNSVLISALKLTCDNNIISNGETAAFTIYECLNATITNNMVNQCPGGLITYAYPDMSRKRIVNLENNTCYGCPGYYGKTSNKNIIVRDKGNVFRNQRIDIENVNDLMFFGKNTSSELIGSRIFGSVKNSYVEFDYEPKNHNLNISLSNDSVNNHFNLGGLQSYFTSIYGTEIIDGKLKININSITKYYFNIADSVFKPILFEAEYTAIGNYDFDINFIDSIIDDSNMQFYSIKSFMNFSSLRNIKNINANIVFKNCKLKFEISEYLLRISQDDINSYNINITIIFEDCEIELYKNLKVYYNNSIKLPNLKLVMNNIKYLTEFRFDTTGVGGIKNNNQSH